MLFPIEEVKELAWLPDSRHFVLAMPSYLHPNLFPHAINWLQSKCYLSPLLHEITWLVSEVIHELMNQEVFGPASDHSPRKNGLTVESDRDAARVIEPQPPETESPDKAPGGQSQGARGRHLRISAVTTFGICPPAQTPLFLVCRCQLVTHSQDRHHPPYHFALAHGDLVWTSSQFIPKKINHEPF